MFVIGGAIAAAAVPLGALPAYAADPPGPPSPPVQPGCTFNVATGQSTCIVTQQGAPTSYILNTGGNNPLPGGVTIAQLCDDINENTTAYNALGISIGGSVSYDATTTTTTTTVHQGVSPDGHQVSQSTVTAAILSDVSTTGSITCLDIRV
jgi:hypothetical protein